MSVWLTIPSARPAEEVAKTMAVWRERGYRIALQRDEKDALVTARDLALIRPDLAMCVPYDGYSRACNRIVAQVMAVAPDAEWFICAGDDTLPDPMKAADEIALECREEALRRHGEQCSGCDLNSRTFDTLLVMQPTGDRWGDTPASRARYGENRGALIDRVAGSAWIGREFVKRTYGGKGPMWPEYFHMRNDDELQLVAEKLGLFWQRRDLTHYHNHCQRETHPGAALGPAPEFLKYAYSRENWDKMTALFESRKAANFPGAFVGADSGPALSE